MKSSAFTLIELLVTMTIIVLMAVVAIPSFSKYQRKAEFHFKMDEAVSKINEVAIKAQNPEKGVASYIALFDFVESGTPVRPHYQLSAANTQSFLKIQARPVAEAIKTEQVVTAPDSGWFILSTKSIYVEPGSVFKGFASAIECVKNQCKMCSGAQITGNTCMSDGASSGSFLWYFNSFNPIENSALIMISNNPFRATVTYTP